MMMDGMMWWRMLMMGLGLIVFLGLIIGGVYLIVRAVRGEDNRDGADTGVRTSSSAVGILEERFARGEIDRDEFEERRRVLSSAPEDDGGRAGDGP